MYYIVYVCVKQNLSFQKMGRILMACTPLQLWRGGEGLKILEKSLKGGSEGFILVGVYCWWVNFVVGGGHIILK